LLIILPVIVFACSRDSLERVSMYEETERSFPVLYYYPGFGQTAMYLSRFTSPLDDFFRKHPEDVFVIVGIDVEGVLRHSFGRTSADTGRWEDFSAKEVPQFIETDSSKRA
jgi:hypothetical protein